MTTKFNAKDHKSGTGTGSKILNPGTQLCRIIDVTLDTPPYNKDAYSIVIHLEGEPLDAPFEGMPVNKLNPSLGNYQGQIGSVNSGRYPFSDYVYDGKDIARDDQMLRWVNNFAEQIGVLDEMKKADIKADTIEEYVEAFKKYAVNFNKWHMFTIGGAEYFKEGYSLPNYRLFFPKTETLSNKTKLYPFAKVNETGDGYNNLLPYDATKHIITATTTIKGKPEEIDNFGGQKEVGGKKEEVEFNVETSSENDDLPF